MSSFNKKTRNPGYKPGGHWVECQRTGKVIRVQDAKEEWTGLIVAKEEWEPRHPQDMLRGRHDDIAAKGLVVPESAGKDTGPITSAIAGIAIAGVAVAGSGEGYISGHTTTIPSGTFNTNTL